MRSFAFCCLALVLVFGAVGCCSSCGTQDNTASAKVGCQCGDGKAGTDLWCADCNVGYVDKAKVKCKGCYKVKVGKADGCAKCAK